MAYPAIRRVEGLRGELDHRPQQAEEAEREGDHPGPIEPVALARPAVVEHPRRDRERGEADRHVDPEDPAPRHVGDDQAAQHDAQHRPGVPADRVVAVRAPALLAREDVGDHGARVRRQQRAAHPLDEAEDDQRHLAPGERARQRPGDEDQEPGLIRAHAAEHVPQAPDLRREHRDHEQIADDHPDHRGEADMQRALDRRQRQHDDRRVDRRDQHARDDDQEREALSARVHGRSRPRRAHRLRACADGRRCHAAAHAPGPVSPADDRLATHPARSDPTSGSITTAPPAPGQSPHGLPAPARRPGQARRALPFCTRRAVKRERDGRQHTRDRGHRPRSA